MPDRTLPGIQQLRHVVVLMMENRSFDHMLGALQSVNPAIDGLNGDETNPDTTGVPVAVSPTAEYQSQLDPDPDHHFAAVDLQIFGGVTATQNPNRTANMQGFVKSYFNQQKERAALAPDHELLHPGKASCTDEAGDRICRVQSLVFVDPRTHALQSSFRALWNLVRPGQHGCLLLEQAI